LGIPIGVPTFTYNGSPTPPRRAGAYTVVASFAGNAKHKPASTTFTMIIGKVTPTINISGHATYDGRPHGVRAAVIGVGGVRIATPTVTYNGSLTRPTN